MVTHNAHRRGPIFTDFFFFLSFTRLLWNNIYVCVCVYKYYNMYNNNIVVVSTSRHLSAPPPRAPGIYIAYIHIYYPSPPPDMSKPTATQVYISWRYVCEYPQHASKLKKKKKYIVYRRIMCIFHVLVIISRGKTWPAHAFKNVYRTKRFVKRIGINIIQCNVNCYNSRTPVHAVLVCITRYVY